jgi:hypothetical protein
MLEMFFSSFGICCLAAGFIEPYRALEEIQCVSRRALPKIGDVIRTVCHGLDCADFFMQITIGTASILILSHSPSLRISLLSDDARTCDGPGSMAFHDVLFLGPVY